MPLLDLARAAPTPEARLTALLEAWRTTKAPELATLIEKLGKQIADVHPRLPGKTNEQKHAAWVELAAAKDPADVALLLIDPYPLADHLFRDLDKKLDALTKLPADPRIAHAIIAILREKNYLGTREPILLRALAKIGDPASLVPLRGFVARKQLGAIAEATKAIAAIAKVTPVPLDAAAKRDLKALSSIGKGTRKTAAALLAEVYTAPADDGPRLVYADALQQVGDPRGEYIVLACAHERGQLDSRGRGRMRKLLAENKTKWLEPLAVALTFGGPKEFRRGFLARAKVTGVAMTDERKIVALYKHPAWALLDEVIFSQPGTLFRAPLVAHLRKLGVKITIV